MRWLGLGRSGAKTSPPRRKGATRGKGRAPARRRPRAPLTWAGTVRALRLTGGLVLLLGVTGGAAWVWQSGVIGRQIDAATAAVERFAARGGLVVRSVTVEGRDRTSSTRLLAALRTGRGEPILAFDPHDARRRVEALPWVRTARIERRLPDGIHVVLDEREALALWQRAPDDFAVIDRTGVAIDVDTRPFAHLPVFVGAGAPAAAPALMAMLATEPDLVGRVRAATLVGGRRWTLQLDDIEDGIDVRLPERRPLAAWRRLAELQHTGDLLARDIDMVDLRLPDRIVVRPRGPVLSDPGAPSAQPPDGQRLTVSAPARET
jgi:cell division protein FtsQ